MNVQPADQHSYKHPGAVFDVTRGLEERFAFALGFGVFRYKDTPDVYMDAGGNVVPDQIAERAGYDVSGDKAHGALRRERAALQARMDADRRATPHHGAGWRGDRPGERPLPACEARAGPGPNPDQGRRLDG